MKKILSFVLTLLMTVSFAFAGTERGLKEAFDELQYALTVEWDQKDEAFRAEALERFQSDLKSSGMTPEDLLAFARTQVKDASLMIRLENAFQSAQSGLISQAEFNQVINEAIAGSQMRGASWENDQAVVIFVGIVAVVLILAAIYDVPVHSTVVVYG